MKVYDETGQLLTSVPDLKKGWLENTQRLVKHHPAKEEKSRVEVMPGTTSLRHLVIDQPAQDAWDEYEDVQVYHPYTPEELAERNKPTESERLDVMEAAMLELMLKQGGVANV